MTFDLNIDGCQYSMIQADQIVASNKPDDELCA